MTEQLLPVRVAGLRKLAASVLGITLEAADGTALPPTPAGAHIEVHVPCPQGTLVRHYSLTSPALCPTAYEIAVRREMPGRGGSAFLHAALRQGDLLQISPPRDRFAVCEAARHTVLIAGGIGIAPIWSQVQRLRDLGVSWEVHYAIRSEAEAAFLADVRAVAGARLRVYGPAEGRLSLADLAAGCAPDAHVYCCGPARMMAAFDTAFGAWPEAHRHREHFAPVAEASTAGGFDLVLARSRRTLHVPAGCTILQVVREAGVGVSFSCAEGVCGLCETRVIEGVADHRDSVLTAQEQGEGKTMMICCSGARTARLVLDL